MRILQLLEGSEILFHATPNKFIRSIATSGSISLSHLLADHSELLLIRRQLKNNTDKLFYLSLARSLHSEYLSKSLGGDITVFEFNSQTISKYGKISAYDYFSDAEDSKKTDEMEDRLISDHPIIPLKVVTRMHVVCSDMMLPTFKHIAETYGIQIVFYKNVDMLKVRKGGMTFDERTSHLQAVTGKFNPVTKNVEQEASILKFIDFGIKFLDGVEQTQDEYKKTFAPVVGMSMIDILKAVQSAHPDTVKKFLIKLRKAGYGKDKSVDTFTSELRKAFVR